MSTTKQYGDPVLTLRVPASMIAGIKIAAREDNTTPSGYIRDMIADDLAQRHININPTPIDGQIDVNELTEA